MLHNSLLSNGNALVALGINDVPFGAEIHIYNSSLKFQLGPALAADCLDGDDGLAQEDLNVLLLLALLTSGT